MTLSDGVSVPSGESFTIEWDMRLEGINHDSGGSNNNEAWKVELVSDGTTELSLYWAKWETDSTLHIDGSIIQSADTTNWGAYGDLHSYKLEVNRTAGVLRFYRNGNLIVETALTDTLTDSNNLKPRFAVADDGSDSPRVRAYYDDYTITSATGGTEFHESWETTMSLSGLSPTEIGSNTAALSWNATGISNTNVQYNPTDKETWQTYSTLAGDVTTETLTGLKNGEAYDVRVVADSDSTIKSTTAVTTILPPDDQPVLSTPAEGQITVDRETVTTNYGSVEVQYRETGASTWNTWSTVPYDFTTIDITNLSDETEYEVRLQTQTEHTSASWTTPVTATTLTPTEATGGTVVNQNGQPVPNATVTITGVDREQLDVDPSELNARAKETCRKRRTRCRRTSRWTATSRPATASSATRPPIRRSPPQR